MIPSEIERLLPKVQKPARYCGGEINTITHGSPKVAHTPRFARQSNSPELDPHPQPNP